MKNKIILLIILVCIMSLNNSTYALAKTHLITLDITGACECVKRPKGVKRAVKAKISNDKKSVVKVKFIKKSKDKRIEFKGIKTGKAKVTVSLYDSKNKKTTYSYSVKVKKSKPLTDKEKGQLSLKLQNYIRKELGVPEITWSDDLYEFALYRLKTSGYDKHENLNRDMVSYFGEYAGYKNLLLSENLFSGCNNVEDVVQGWCESPGHYRNMIDPEHAYGAVACLNGMWCAVFKDGEEINGWDQIGIKAVTLKRYDAENDLFVCDCRLGYYIKDEKDTTHKVITIKDAEGEKIYLLRDKTYVIYEIKPPIETGRAERMVIDIDDNTPSELIIQ